MSPVLFPVFDNEGKLNQMKAWCCAAMEAGPGLKLSIRHIEEGTVGCDPNRPAEDPGLLLLLAHSLSRTFGDQSPTHNKRGSNWEAEQRDRKGRMLHKNPCGCRTPGLLVSAENSQRDFLDKLCTTSLSQAHTSVRCQAEHLPAWAPFWGT